MSINSEIKSEYTSAEVAFRLQVSIRLVQVTAKRTGLAARRGRTLVFPRENAIRLAEIINAKARSARGNPSWKRKPVDQHWLDLFRCPCCQYLLPAGLVRDILRVAKAAEESAESEQPVGQ